MQTGFTNLRYQWPVITTIGKVLGNKLIKPKPTGSIPTLPSKTIVENIGPRNPDLVHDFIVHTGGDPKENEGLVPFHMFPQWTFPTLGKINLDLPYDFSKIINLGCRAQVNGPLRREEGLRLTGQIESVDDDGTRAIITNKLVTETPSSPKALVVQQYAMIPLASKPKKKHSKEVKRVPATAKTINYIDLSKTSGLEFAFLTGDVNPLHWLTPWARSIGFEGSILHGFSGMSRTIEALVNHNPETYNSYGEWDFRFTAPIPLPCKVGVFIDGSSFYLGAARGGKAYLIGSFISKN